MRKLFIVGLLAVSCACYTIAREAAGRGAEMGKAAEDAKVQIMKFEKEKVPVLLKGGAAWAGWLDKMDSKDIVMINGGGVRPTHEEWIEKWRTGQMKQAKNNQHDHQVYAYNNGNVAVLTYIGTTLNTLDGKTTTDDDRAVDVWVKQNGEWLRVVHANTPMTGMSKGE
jgi:hypothetical protein